MFTCIGCETTYESDGDRRKCEEKHVIEALAAVGVRLSGGSFHQESKE